jgi:hypothetical protein
MSAQIPNVPLPFNSTPDVADNEFSVLLSEPFAQVWAQPVASLPGAQAGRERLLGRLVASRAEQALMFTARRRRVPRQTLSEGVVVQMLYECQADLQTARNLRPGEPLRVRLIEMAAGTSLPANVCASESTLRSRRCEWLVISGSVRRRDERGDERLSARDYFVSPAGHESPIWFSEEGAQLFLRESDVASDADELPFTVRDADAGWPDFAPGIARRVLWQRDGQAAMLYYAQAGAEVPIHTHGHDEECLMVQGELFLDDLLLQAGDYQLAPAGSGHRITHTDTGVVIYAHGDLDLKFAE